jgi:predicted permease
MNLLPYFRSVAAKLLHRSQAVHGMEEELCSHIQHRADDLEHSGLGRAEAERRARIEFGSQVKFRAECYEALGGNFIESLAQDVRFSLRMLRKSPGFTAIAIASLALGIGANTAIFILAKQVLLDRLAVPHPEQLQLFRWIAPKRSIVHSVWGGLYSTPGGQQTSASFPYPVYRQLRRENHSLGDLFAFKNVGRLSATVGGGAIAVQGQMVSGNYYQALGVQPALGRAILPSDDAVPGSGAVAVISDGFWIRQFGRSTSVLGKTMDLNGKPVTIIGVNPPNFTGAGDAHLSPDVFLPFSMQPVIQPNGKGSVLNDPNLWWVDIMARSQAGAPVQAAQAAFDTIFQSLARANAKPEKDEAIPHLVLADGSRGLNRSAGELAQPMYVLMALAGLVLLLACANMANLLLARFAARQREMGVRMALGAGRARIARQMLTESLLLSSFGGIAGFALGYLGRNTLPDLLFPPLARAAFHGHFDWRVFAFTVGITLFTGVLFGLAPAWKAMRTDVSSELKNQPQTVTHRRKGFAGKSVVSFQVALSTLLVVGAGLFVRTLLNLDSVNPGFRTDHLLLFTIQLPISQFPPPTDVATFRRMEEKLGSVPGVESVTLSADALIANNVSMDSFIRLDQPSGKHNNHETWDNAVGQSFFSTMGIPIAAGRSFNSTDTPTAPRVAIINRKLARQIFPHSNPIGKTFRGYYANDTTPFQIVGICADAHYNSLRHPSPATYYVLYDQLPRSNGEMTYELRTHVKPDSLVPEIRRAVQSVDKNLPLIDIRTQAEQIDDTIQQEKLMAGLTASFGILALILACIGIYGIMAYTVARRTNEIGVRLALGAQPQQILGMILSETSRLTLVGVAVGLSAALMVTRLLRTMLFGLKADDPATLVSATLLLLAVALLAGFIPALRASHVEPMQALRHE